MIGCSSNDALRGRVSMLKRTRRHNLFLGSTLAIFCGAILSAQGGQPPQKKLSDAEKKEIQAVLKIVDDAVAGQSAPDDLALAWVHHDLLKAQGNKQYVPFSVAVDPSKVAGGKVSLY